MSRTKCMVCGKIGKRVCKSCKARKRVVAPQGKEKNEMKKQKFPKPEVIGAIPMVEIGGEVWGFEVSVLSKEEQEALKQEGEAE